MTEARQFAGTAVVLGIVTLVHGVVTWPVSAVVALFAGGAVVAFVVEAVAINLGWLEHHIGPRVLGVPLYILLGWTGTIYAAFRLGLLVADGPMAVLATGLVATTYDVFTDHRGVADGHWTYTDELPGPRFRGVPWWNFVGWFLISTVTAALALPFL